MADPSGPTVAEGPEEQEATSTDRSAEARSPSSDAPKPTDPAADGAPPEHAVEGPGPTADDTGTVDPGPDAATATPIDSTPEASTTTDRWPAAAAPEVGSAEPPSGRTGVTGTDTDADIDTSPGATDDVADRSRDGDDSDGDDEVDDEDDGDEDGPKGGLLDKKVQLDAKVLLVVLGFLALAVGAYFLGQRQAKDDDVTAGPGTTPATTFVQPTEYVPFVDEETGIKLSIPKGWTQRSTKNLGPEARMLIEVPNTQDTVLVRVNSYSKEVTKENLNDQKAVIDAIFAGEKVTILGVEAGDLKGRPVLVYVYRFNDPQTGVAGIHAHYFVFQGRKAVQLVFQALPEDHYTSGGLGVVWGKISESLEVTPGPPPAFLEQLGGTVTTVPGATPAPTAPPPSAPPSTG